MVDGQTVCRLMEEESCDGIGEDNGFDIERGDAQEEQEEQQDW